MSLVKKARKIADLSVEEAANMEQQPEETDTNTVGIPTPDAALTTKEQEIMIANTAESLGIALRPSEIKEIILGSTQDIRNNANKYKAFAFMAITSYIQRIERQNQNDLLEINQQFVEKLNQTNRNFEEGIRTTFQGVRKQVTESNKQSAETLAVWQELLSEDTFWD
jgi:hypothetical protein